MQYACCHITDCKGPALSIYILCNKLNIVGSLQASAHFRALFAGVSTCNFNMQRYNFNASLMNGAYFVCKFNIYGYLCSEIDKELDFRGISKLEINGQKSISIPRHC